MATAIAKNREYMDENQRKLFRKLLKLHQPTLVRKPMVYEIWEDGEVTSTKGGELYRCRNLHCIVPGFPVSLPEKLPQAGAGEHSCIVVAGKNVAAARGLIAAILGVDDKFRDCLPS